jgi:hypothetical protein
VKRVARHRLVQPILQLPNIVDSQFWIGGGHNPADRFRNRIERAGGRTTMCGVVINPWACGTKYAGRGASFSVCCLTSLTTPTTSRHGVSGSVVLNPSLIRLPSGFSPGKHWRAKLSLMMTVRGEASVSAVVNSRPTSLRSGSSRRLSAVSRCEVYAFAPVPACEGTPRLAALVASGPDSFRAHQNRMLTIAYGDA